MPALCALVEKQNGAVPVEESREGLREVKNRVTM